MIRPKCLDALSNEGHTDLRHQRGSGKTDGWKISKLY